MTELNRWEWCRKFWNAWWLAKWWNLEGLWRLGLFDRLDGLECLERSDAWKLRNVWNSVTALIRLILEETGQLQSIRNAWNSRISCFVLCFLIFLNHWWWFELFGTLVFLGLLEKVESSLMLRLLRGLGMLRMLGVPHWLEILDFTELVDSI